MSGGVQVNQSESRIDIVCMVFLKNYFVLSVLISTVFCHFTYSIYSISHTSQIYSKWNTYFTYYYVIFIKHATLRFSTELLHIEKNASKHGQIIKANI